MAFAERDTLRPLVSTSKTL